MTISLCTVQCVIWRPHGLTAVVPPSAVFRRWRNTDRSPAATGREIGRANFAPNSAPFTPALTGGAPLVLLVECHSNRLMQCFGFSITHCTFNITQTVSTDRIWMEANEQS